MSDFAIVNQDKIIWMNSFGTAATVAPPQGNVIASAKTTTVAGKAPALEGDESKWQSLPVGYTDPPYSTPGMAIAKVVSLGKDQLTKTVTCEGKKVVLKGSNFTAKLEVTTPATMPSAGGPVPDPKAVKTGGQGKFVNSNTKVKMG